MAVFRVRLAGVRPLVTFTGARESSLESADSPGESGLPPAYQRTSQVGGVTGKRRSRPSLSELSHAYISQVEEERQEMLSHQRTTGQTIGVYPPPFSSDDTLAEAPNPADPVITGKRQTVTFEDEIHGVHFKKFTKPIRI